LVVSDHRCSVDGRIAITEVWLFSFLGNIVDWLSVQNRETFIQNEGWKLVGMGLLVMLLLPPDDSQQLAS